MKKISLKPVQLKFEFKEVKKAETKQVKVISLQKIQSDELTTSILNRKRPNY